jgi:glycosyltransferase involved in cell wall biosynthesis
VIAGNDMGARRAIARDVARRGLGDRTRFTGLLTGRARLELLADADVVAYASEREIFGLVPLESLLSGSPVVVANDSGAGEVVTSVGGGLVVPPGDADALATALDAILADRIRWRSAARGASERVRERYGPDRIARETTRLYESLLARSGMVPA